MEITLRLVESEAGEKRQGVQIGLKSRYTRSQINPAPVSVDVGLDDK